MRDFLSWYWRKLLAIVLLISVEPGLQWEWEEVIDVVLVFAGFSLIAWDSQVSYVKGWRENGRRFTR